MNKQTIWLVWRWTTQLEALGAYSSEERARARCELPCDGIEPLVLDEPLPDETIPWQGAYYPLAEVQPDAAAAR